ncbi:ASST-domain-containing protein [Aspergillus taichungensis]|uniref:ASST-domain-containing protein n=1 Tax=Aspergillus taichungensis TaxID=482145 RepID=A0A2J5I8Z6_9EURO|nr:ASST-domain-containing protein [Aspergillus taichungensis]
MILFVLLALSLLHGVIARRDDDLMSFVTLPEIRALKWEVVYHDRERVSPGYWFVAPYGKIVPENPTHKFQPYQVGPYIYDGDGVLIWAGPPIFYDRNVFDFKAFIDSQNETHLSLIAQRNYDDSTRGRAAIMNSHYEIEQEIMRLEDNYEFNIHEFNVLDGGKSALACVYRSKELPLDDVGRPGVTSFFMTGGFVEWDLTTKEIVFAWDSADHLAIHESVKFDPNNPAGGPPGWDYVHMNAVDKNADGDYLISMRFTNTLYLISGKDGSVIWRLGGQESDFVQDFVFSKQHDAKFLESSGTHHVISLLNNAGDENQQEEEVSSALIVELDTAAMTAKLQRRYPRPDGLLTLLRGSVQRLPNGNVFVGWSERGYQSEFSPEGDNLVSARFASDRLNTYRAYKFDFVGRPAYAPTMVASVYAADEASVLTTIHISWNGATDIASWNFYAQAGEEHPRHLIGNVPKRDFETMFIASGYMDWISADALDRDGNVITVSDIIRSKPVTTDWPALGYHGQNSSGPAPDDPAVRYPTDSPAPVEKPPATAADAEPAHAETTSAGEASATAQQIADAMMRVYESLNGVGGVLIGLLVLCSMGGAVAGIVWMVRSRRSKKIYQHVPDDEDSP